MAIGTKSDFVIYNPEYWLGVTETLEQETRVFNASSMGAVRLTPRRLKGEYEKESFIENITGLVSRRDPTSTADVDDLKMEQDELIGVKLNRKIGPVANTLDSWRKISETASFDPREMSYLLGLQQGKTIAVDYINASVASLVASISGVAALNYDATGDSPSTLTHTTMVKGMSKMGDQASRVAAWMMHSKNHFDLMQNAIGEKIFEVAGVTIYSGSVASFGKPVIITDSASFIDGGATSSAGDDTYSVLGLVPGAVEIAESEERFVTSDLVTGKQNLVMRIQGEYAFNLKVKGFAWNTGSGVNPTDAAIANSSNWTFKMDSHKSGPGFRIEVK